MMNNRIYDELCADERANWFELKGKKFLHNIDTFYYSVKLLNDFRDDTKDLSCLRLRTYFNEYKKNKCIFDFVTLDIPGYDGQLNYIPFGHFGGYYNIRIECPDMFDIFIAPSVPQGSDGGESVTSELIVQIRSYMLWQYGATKAFEYSYEAVKSICSFFDLKIGEIKENRVDFCWHSNYLQNPDKFFAPHNMAQRIVTTLGRKDRKGIIARVSNFLYEHDINIEDISQTIMQDFFSMVMMVNVDEIKISFNEIVKKCNDLSEEMGLEIRIQSEDIFNAMHKI